MISKIPKLTELFTEILKALRSVLTFLSGMLAGRAAIEKKVERTKDEADNQQDQNDADFERLKRNKHRRNRLLDLIRGSRGSD